MAKRLYGIILTIEHDGSETDEFYDSLVENHLDHFPDDFFEVKGCSIKPMPYGSIPDPSEKPESV